jgi:adenine-specific DNA-methyltransferase
VAKLDDLIEQVEDSQLRAELMQAGRELRRRKTFGLVFEEHIPEVTLLHDFPVRPGATVYRREDTATRSPMVVERVTGKAAIVKTASGGRASVSLDRLVVLKRFGDPVYPVLTPVGTLAGDSRRPHHAVISAENFHALQLLTFMYEGQVDCIYIDPPYNSGARDWTYNNDFVDRNDRWRHSKWLSMMEKRLRLAKRLLNPAASVLIVAIDEKEVHRLGLLLEEVFRGARQQMVTSVINPRGVHRAGEFARCEEHLLFVRIGAAEVASEPDPDYAVGAEVPWRTFRRSDLSSARGTSKGGRSQFYPIYVREATGQIAAIGRPLPHEAPRSSAPARAGCVAVFPVRRDGTEMNWGLTPAAAEQLLQRGYLRVGRRTAGPQPFEISYLTSGRIADIEQGRARVIGRGPSDEVVARYESSKHRMPLTVWSNPSHNAETGGTNVLKALLGDKRFAFPKSVYAVRDCLRLFVGNRPDALILDFFAGSGTTLHATCMLNAADGGRRRCVLVTSNEVEERLAQRLHREGHFAGRPAYDRHGVFEAVCRPRCEAVITGRRPGGQPVPGSHLDGRPFSEGFDESCTFMRLDYVDPDEVELGRRFQAILPMLWLASGGVGPLPRAQTRSGYLLPAGCPFAVLLRESAFARLTEALRERPDVTHIWLITDSERAFADMRAALPGRYCVSMLYRDYLRSFAINTQVRGT